MAHPPQPVFILGGFLITAEAYVAMVETLARLTGQPVRPAAGRSSDLPRHPPHRPQGHTALKATPLWALVEQELLGAFHSQDVVYTSVAGALSLDPAAGEARDSARRLVPLAGALLPGSRPIVLDGVADDGAFGGRWSGSPEVGERWWSPLDQTP